MISSLDHFGAISGWTHGTVYGTINLSIHLLWRQWWMLRLMVPLWYHMSYQILHHKWFQIMKTEKTVSGKVQPRRGFEEVPDPIGEFLFVIQDRPTRVTCAESPVSLPRERDLRDHGPQHGHTYGCIHGCISMDISCVRQVTSRFPTSPCPAPCDQCRLHNNKNAF